MAKQMLGLDKQSEKLKANIGQLFGGLNIEPVLAGFQKLVALSTRTPPRRCDQVSV
ncbi:MAG: hypothetical protein WDO74_17055 [Pseudomonadota bacterium]